MIDPTVRDDLSRFVVHLTREYDGNSPLSNLRRILANRTIEARSVNCVYGPLLGRLGLTKKLKSKFETVCFTETPLTQVRHLTNPKLKRQIELAPYGLVFRQDFLLEHQGGPVHYLNAIYDTDVRDMLLADFRKLFAGRASYAKFSKKYADADARIRHLAMHDVRRPYHDFSWEREWRHVGDLRFDYDDLVAIICPSVFRLKQSAKKMSNRGLLCAWDSLATIDINACVDEWLETLSSKIKQSAALAANRPQASSN